MNSAEGWHLKKGHIRRLEPFKVTPGDLAESSTFEDVTRRRVAVRTRVLVEGVLGRILRRYRITKPSAFKGWYTGLAPFFEESGFVPLRAVGKLCYG